MGWSATAAACEVMDKLANYCAKDGGSTNGWTYNGNKYFTMLGKEFADGHITMTIYKIVMVKGQERCKRSGSIYINPDGTVRRMPKYLREAIALPWPTPIHRMSPRELWEKACEFDHCNPSEKFVVFSPENPYVRMLTKKILSQCCHRSE